jgi:mono/diheme cytochrome c family protein
MSDHHPTSRTSVSAQVLLVACAALCMAAMPRDNRALEWEAGEEARQLSVHELIERVKVHELSVLSPAYGNRKKTYIGFYFEDLLAYAQTKLSDYGEVQFHCRDGYVSHWSPSQVPVELFVAIGEKGNPDRWEALTEGKTTYSPDPFYVITRDVKDAKRFSWAHQLVKVRFVSKTAVSLAYPKNAEKKLSVMDGYSMFQRHCQSCHTVNLDGGEIGPELNIPKNITEYRDRSYLRTFIENPSAYRAKSRMPAFDHLGPKVIDQILGYLQYMKRHKDRSRL